MSNTRMTVLQFVIVSGVRQNIRKIIIIIIIFTMRVLRYWNKLPKEAVNVSSSETFEVGLDRTLNSLSVSDYGRGFG